MQNGSIFPTSNPSPHQTPTQGNLPMEHNHESNEQWGTVWEGPSAHSFTFYWGLLLSPFIFRVVANNYKPVEQGETLLLLGVRHCLVHLAYIKVF